MRLPRSGAKRRAIIVSGLMVLGILACEPSARAETTLRMVGVSPLTSLDPVILTAAFIRNHGFLVYDQLFALDANGKPQPEMVGATSVSADGLSYTFTLRDGLLFHDGATVRAADAVASIRRWEQRDVVGKALAAVTASLDVQDAHSFTLRLSHPFGLVLQALARPTASALFVMPERIATTPASTAITDATGSGPFIFEAASWRAGDRAVYRRNPAYVPRTEPQDGLAGGKVVKIDRLEWLSIPDASTAVGALKNGEIDYLEQPSPDLIGTLSGDPAIKLMAVNPVGFEIWVRINHAVPPFNDPRAREALLYLIDQEENLQAAGIHASEQVPYCGAYFLCGTPLETEAGAKGLRAVDIPRAKELLKQAGYDGRRVVFLNATDLPVNNAATLTVAEHMKQAGINVDTPAMDWATLTQRRGKKDPVDQGGWNLFITIANVLDAGNPLTDLYLASPCEGGLAGWPCDAKLEELRHAWADETDPAKQRQLLDAVQTRAYEVLPYINGGQFRTLTAFRANVTGVQATTIPVFWGIEKK
jgi:peptide/nickel transport system substrate-binding protein